MEYGPSLKPELPGWSEDVVDPRGSVVWQGDGTVYESTCCTARLLSLSPAPT